MTNVVTADAQGNLQCAVPIESMLQQSTAAVVTAVDVTYTASSGNLAVSVQDITGAVKQDSVTLPTSTQNISTWSNGTTQSIVLGSDGKLYLANPTGAPSTHNPVAKTNNVDWFGAFTTLNDLLQYALSGGSFLASNSGYLKHDTAPTLPKAGDTWRTTSATAAPYAKNATYQWDGTTWLLIGGRPVIVTTASGMCESAVGVGTRFDNIDLAVGFNDLNATVHASEITIPRGGIYRVDAYIDPASTVATGAGGAYYSLDLCINGLRIVSVPQMGFINGVVGTACHATIAGSFNAGDLIEIQLYVNGMVLTYGTTLKVTAIG